MRGCQLNPHTRVEPTDVSYGWIFEHLDGRDARWDKLRKRSAITGVQVEVISGAGFLSYVLRVMVYFADHRDSFNVVLKVPTTDRLGELGVDLTHNNFADKLIKFHNQEIMFYTKIANGYDELYFPKMYAWIESDPRTGKHGRILVEDVGHLGVLPSVIDGMNMAKCEEAIRSLARFHAYTYCKLDSRLILEVMQMQDGYTDKAELSEHLFQLDPYFNDQRPALEEMLQKHGEMVSNPHFKFGIPPILTHGDFWANNMFFKKAADGSCSDELLTVFDWQLPNIGTGMNDLSRLLTTSAQAEVLEEHVDRLLSLYYQTLDESLRKRGRAMPYKFDRMMEMFRFEYPNEFLFAAMILPTIAARVHDRTVRSEITRRLKLGFLYASESMGRATT